MTNERKGKNGRKTKPKYKQKAMQEMSSSYTLLKDEEPSKPFKVYIYRSEYKKIKKWVLLHRNIETGGDLFGLWLDSHTAVVQFALGPGKNCRRYPTAFYQDLDYLANAGNHLTKKHGLCNIGQWHSHHQLSLSEPSGGDERTVWNHMPALGLTRYIVCIANIRQTKLASVDATVNCFLFELDDGDKLPVQQGKFKILENSSPVNKHSAITEVTAEGAEIVVSDSESEETPRERSWWWWLTAGSIKCLNVKRWRFMTCILVSMIVLALIIVLVYLNKDKLPLL